MAAESLPDETAVAAFRDGFRGLVLRPDDPGYDEARAVWNGMIDRRPALVAQCAGVADVIDAVTFAREQDLLVAIKGAGHNIAGNAVCDDGLVIDLSGMRSVRVDPEARTARVEPGTTLGMLDRETQAFGLAVPTGINSTTGVAGLTLGGGFGWLSRRDGLTVDNLRSVDVVTADGELRRASERENPDLFWGIRGGGGNFGVVTSFEFDLHPVGPAVLAGLVVHPLADAPELLRAYREFVADSPRELTVWFVLRHAPPLPFLPEEVHGSKILVFAACYAGDPDEGERLVRPLRDLGDPIADVVAPQPFVEWQRAFDPLLTEGARNYWKSHNFTDLTDGMLDVFVEYAETMPAVESEVFVGQLGGAVNDVPADATAYPHRDAAFATNVHTRWTDPAMDDECIAWARDLHGALAPHATGGAYVNFISERTGEEHVAYGANYDRLVEIKNEYDPDNLFRTNQNVEPTL
ncbi:FAD-binding oxidoreductase [Halomarina pelagica]|uniref:FAD-binding oxidoreductase n=1 Tax=Halomarina pelagica TaxID=2961599 RepID=UPI0020C52523|nr:FAD-binding oxidoreductase [Halomarina sp. BND7]